MSKNIFEDIYKDLKTKIETGIYPSQSMIPSHFEGRTEVVFFDHFLKDAVRGLDREIASNSIYEYLEGVLGMKIMTSKRRVKVELADDCDKKFLELGEFNCVAVVSSRTYNSEGIQFEYTQSRHHPDFFCFEDTATRKSID